MLFLLKKLAENAFMYPNQVLTLHTVASEQPRYFLICFHIGSVSWLTSSAAELHTKVPRVVLFKGYIRSS